MRLLSDRVKKRGEKYTENRVFVGDECGGI